MFRYARLSVITLSVIISLTRFRLGVFTHTRSSLDANLSVPFTFYLQSSSKLQIQHLIC